MQSTGGRADPNRSALPAQVTGPGVIAVLRAADADAYEAVVETLIADGVLAIELTLTTPRTIELLPHLVSTFPSASIGVGTVLAAAAADDAISAGAAFVVSPCPVAEVIATTVARHVPVLPGAMTPAEAWAAWSTGAAAVKIFPASTVGPEFVGHLAGPFPDLVAVPSGGVSFDAIDPWIRAGAPAVSLGGPLVGDAFSSGNHSALRNRTRRALDAVQMARTNAK